MTGQCLREALISRPPRSPLRLNRDDGRGSDCRGLAERLRPWATGRQFYRKASAEAAPETSTDESLMSVMGGKRTLGGNLRGSCSASSNKQSLHQSLPSCGSNPTTFFTVSPGSKEAFSLIHSYTATVPWWTRQHAAGRAQHIPSPCRGCWLIVPDWPIRRYAADGLARMGTCCATGSTT